MSARGTPYTAPAFVPSAGTARSSTAASRGSSGHLPRQVPGTGHRPGTGAAAASAVPGRTGGAVVTVGVTVQLPPSRKTEPAVRASTHTSCQSDHVSMYRLSKRTRSSMEVSPRRPCTWASPVMPTGIRWRAR